MKTATEIIRSFYNKLGAGDAPGALGLMAPDIVHGKTGKQAAARYAHVWTVKNGKITRFRQYIDTLAVEKARVQQDDGAPVIPFARYLSE